MSPHEFIRANRGAIVIAGSRYAADDLVREACDSTLLGIQRYTFRGLVYALSMDAMNARGLTPLGRIAREAIAASVARQMDLKYLHDVVRFPVFRPRSPIPVAISASTGFRSRNSAIPVVAAPISLSSSRHMRPNSDASISLIIRSVSNSRSRAAAPFRPSRPASRPGVPDRCRTRARRHAREPRAAHLIAGCSEAPAPPATALQAVQRFALSGDRVPERSPDASVAFLSASSEALEFVEIARRALHSAVPFDQIAILLRNPRRHGPLVREALQRAGIPAHYTGGTEHADLGGRAFLRRIRRASFTCAMNCFRALNSFHEQVRLLWFRSLRRRSQRLT